MTACSALAQTSGSGQTTLPEISVEAKKAAKKTTPPKKAPPAAAAPAPKAAPPEETATSPVKGYVAKQSATGTKTDTPIKEIPQSITVVGTEQMRDQGVQALQDALRYTPGIVADGFGFDSRGDYSIVRGIPAAFFLDGMRTAYGYYLHTIAAEPYALERVEVLRGPASMLFGQAPSGGIINMISKLPREDDYKEITLEYGSYDFKQIKTDMTGKLTPDGKWLYRFVGLARDADTQVDFVENDRLMLAPSITYRPTKNTSITVLGTWREDHGGSVQQFQPHEGTLFPNRFTGQRISPNTFVGEPTDYNDTSQKSVSLLFDHKFDPSLSLHHGSRYTHTDNTYNTHFAAPLKAWQLQLLSGLDPTIDPTGSTAPFLDAGRQQIARVYLFRDTSTDVVTSDTNLTARFDAAGVQHKVTGGFDYMRFATGGVQSPLLVDNLITLGGFGQPAFNAYNPVYGQATPFYLTTVPGFPPFGLVPTSPLPLEKRGDETQTQMGVYLQDQIKLGPWTAVLGLRKDWLDIDQTASVTYVGTAVPASHVTESELTGRAGLMYSFASGFTPYVSYSQAFTAQPGEMVADDPANPMVTRPATPLIGEQYEVGFKYAPSGLPFAINAAVYDLTEKNRLVLPDIPGGSSQQGATAHIRGFEIEAIGQLTRNIRIMAAYSYTDAKFDEHVNAYEVGSPVEGVPRHMASLWAIYTLRDGPLEGLSFGGGVRYIGETHDVGIDPSSPVGAVFSVTTPAYTLFDAMVAYETKSWRWQLTGTNLENEYHVVMCGARGDCGVGQMRTIITSLTYKF